MVFMNKQVVLVTGANGYIGSNVVNTLLELGHEVVAASLHNTVIDKRARYIQTDIFDLDANAFELLGSPDICIHLAWQNGFVHNSISHLQDLPLHYQFMENLVSGGLEKIVVLGSMHELGYIEGMATGHAEPRPQSLYGIAKNALHQSLEVLRKGHPFALQWLRGYYIVGQDSRNHSVFTKILEAAAQGRQKFPFTSGKNKYDFIDVEELALEIVLAASQTDIQGVINCCSGTAISLRDQVENFIENNKLSIELDYGAYPDRPYDSPIIYGDNTQIKQILIAAAPQIKASPLASRYLALLAKMGVC
jgi:dTDP-6-deoxy-L-talose 4-dehydrogenase (NAD+)